MNIGNKVQEFLNERFGEVRVINIEGDFWFCAYDVANSLNYASTRKVTDKIDDEDVIEISKSQLTNFGTWESKQTGGQDVKFINESGLYQAVLSVTKKDKTRYELSRDFKRWVTKEVLPTLRKDGMYVNREEEVQSVEELNDIVDVAMERKILRKFGIGVRKDWTKTISKHWKIKNKFQFATYTNELVYKPIFGKTAKQLKEEFKVEKLRDDLFTLQQLSDVAKLENEICTLVEFGADYYGVKDYMNKKYKAS